MTLASGLGGQAGFKKETTWGTAVTVDTFYEFDSESFALERDYYESAGIRANRTFSPSTHTKATTRRAGGSIDMAVPTKKFGAILDQTVQATVTPSVVTGTAYSSTFSIGTAQPNKSGTWQFNRPTTQAADTAFTYPGCVLASLSFSMDVGGALTCSHSWLAKDETTPSTTPAGAALASASYASGSTVFTHNEMSLTLNGSPAAAVTAVNWTWEQPYADGRFHLGGAGTRAKPIPNGFASVTGTLSAEWYDSTYYDLFRSGAFVALVATATESTAITGSTYPSFTNTFSAVQIRGSSPNVSGPDLLTIDVPFVAKDNGSAAPWTSVVVSTDSAAW